jgi:putative methyltransferase (TIGR01177 family)
VKSLLFLSGEDQHLAESELLGVLKSLRSESKPVIRDGRCLIFNESIPAGTAKRMGYCHFSGSLFGHCSKEDDEIDNLISDFIRDQDPGSTITVKTVSPDGKDHLSTTRLFEKFTLTAGENRLKLNHRNPDTRSFLIVGERVYIGEVEETTDRGLARSRRGSKMPFNRPIVMDPFMARCMVNLTGLPSGSKILDPFMGPAGLSIEAGHLGHLVIGVERDPEIFEGASRNIEAQDLGSMIQPQLGDSRKLEEYPWWNEIKSIDGIVTDPPFGRSASLMGEDPSELVREVISIAGRKMKRGSPLIMDSSMEEILLDIPGFRMVKSFPVRIHRSLTRFIGVLERI